MGGRSDRLSSGWLVAMQMSLFLGHARFAAFSTCQASARCEMDASRLNFRSHERDQKR
jgi:hypothetical protein